MKHSKIWNNNKGFSLVELIVSIAILAIIVLPLLNAFVVSTQTNAKSREKLRATEVAQNIMEGLESVSLEEAAKEANYPVTYGFSILKASSLDSASIADTNADNKFAWELKKSVNTINDPTTGLTSDVVSFNTVSLSESQAADVDFRNKTNYSLISSSVVHERNEDKYIFKGSSDHKYYFYLEGIKTNNKVYNALVTIDAKNATYDLTDATQAAAAANDKYYQHNQNSTVSTLRSIDVNYDAICEEELSIADACDLLNTSYIIGTTKRGTGNVRRTITVKIDKDVSTGITKVTQSYSYSYYNGLTTVTVPAAGSLEYTSVCFDNTGKVDKELRDVYIFYTPMYTSTATLPDFRDNIIIKNANNVACTVNIIKQKDAGMTVTELQTKEVLYLPNISLEETGNNLTSYAKIKTNIGYNLAKDADSGNEESGQLASVQYKTDTATIGGTNAKRVMGLSGATQGEATDRLFETTIEIYEGTTKIADLGSATPITTFTGGMTD